jgi:hypothetical protein
MTLGLHRLPRRSNSTTRSSGPRAVHPQKPTNSLVLGREPLSDGPNEGPPPKALRTPRTSTYGHTRSAQEGQPKRIRACYRSPQKGVVHRVIRWS